MTYAVLIILAPLFGAIFAGAFGRYFSPALSYVVTAFSVGVAAVASGFVLEAAAYNNLQESLVFLPWISIGDFSATWEMRLDLVSGVMGSIVSVISFFIHVYSFSYMEHEEGRVRFISYVSLFTFFMLLLVYADNLLQLFVGWEGVGFVSYLLVGFYFHKDDANAAAIKAFVVNRVGDFALVLGLIGLYWLFGSLNITDMVEKLPEVKNTIVEFGGVSWHLLSVIMMLCFIGCMGKSAQLFLHVWLPDAMHGPTPVSALMHSATMVKAGIFLVLRLSFLFEEVPPVLNIMAIVGTLTAFVSATIALTQYDAKRVTAYSTCSQLGFMFMGLGLSAYSASFFHLVTHAFFKSLMFLGVGSVSHALNGELDIRRMGNGLWRKTPFTHIVLLIAGGSLVGLPLLSGAYSKTKIMDAALGVLTPTGSFVFWIGCCTIVMTTLYTCRLLYKIFYHDARSELPMSEQKKHEEVHSHAHESDVVMLTPLIILALACLVIGRFSENHFITNASLFWQEALETKHLMTALQVAHEQVWGMIVEKSFLITGLLLFLVFYILRPSLRERVRGDNKPLYQFIFHKWYFDEAYDAYIAKPLTVFGQFFSEKVDRGIIDKWGPHYLSDLALRVGSWVRALQTGRVYEYAFFMLLGLVLLMLGFFIELP
jgi:NADH-quinone oxidoreductase subunit L